MAVEPFPQPYFALVLCRGFRSLDRGSYGADGRGAAFVFLLVSVFTVDHRSGRKEEKVKLQLDKGRRYGIVLEGGGARGAYQIGAWKALKKGIQIQGAAGTSVGALNGALICMDDFETAEKIWENIRYSQVMDVDDKRMEALREWNLKTVQP